VSEDLVHLIARLEDERYAAMIAGDLAALDRLLDDRLRYTHSSGHSDSKASYLSALREGRFKYLSIVREDETVVALDNTVAVFNTLRIEAIAGGASRQIHSSALAVWSRAGGVWKLGAVLSASKPAS
jgi:Domain of unknown function (DUF4440)